MQARIGRRVPRDRYSPILRFPQAIRISGGKSEASFCICNLDFADACWQRARNEKRPGVAPGRQSTRFWNPSGQVAEPLRMLFRQAGAEQGGLLAPMLAHDRAVRQAESLLQRHFVLAR